MSRKSTTLDNPVEEELWFVWASRICVAICVPVAILYNIEIFTGIVEMLHSFTATPAAFYSTRPEHYLAFVVATVFSITFAFSTVRLFYLRRWAAIALAAFGWFGTFAMMRTFSGWNSNEWPLLLVLPVTLLLTAAIALRWRLLKSGF